MKVVAFEAGHLNSLFPVEAFAPLSGLNERQLIGAIGQRYSFGSSPNMSSRAEVQRTGLVFEFGFFATEVGEVTIHLSIHNDGVVVRANKTEHAEAFLEDMTRWLVSDCGCRKVQTKSFYLSEIVVDFEKPISNALGNYDKWADLLLSTVSENREARAVAFNSLSMEFVTSAGVIPRFFIERRIGTTVQDERYFCSAPLTTERHVAVLEEMEHLFS